MKKNGSPFVTRNSQLVILFTLVAFALRLTQLDFQPLWGDEGWSVYFAVMPLGDMLRLTAADIHPPLYYALLKGFFALAGTGAIQARLLSVLAGTLLVPVMAALGRRLIPVRGGGLAAAGVAALAPMAVYYSQEVRMYGLVTLFGALSTVFLLDWLAGNRRAGWGYAITAALGLYTMYYAVFVIAAQMVFVIFVHRERRENTKIHREKIKITPGSPRYLCETLCKKSAPFLGAAILYLPWVIFAARPLTEYVAQKVVVESYTPLNLGQFLLAYLTAFSVGQPSTAALKPLSGMVVLLALAGVWFLAKEFGEHRAHGEKYEKARWTLCHLRESLCNLYFLLLYLLIPLLLGWLVNLLNPFTPRFFERTLLVAAPAWWLLAAAGIVFLWRWRLVAGWVSVAVMMVISGASLFDFYSVPRYPADDYRPLMAEIAARAAPDDVLLASYQWQLGFYEAYLPAESQPQIVPVPEWGKLWGTDETAMRRDLTAMLENHTVWFPAHQSLGHLWEDRAEAIMADVGFPAELRWVNPNTKLSVVGKAVPVQPALTANFDDRLRAIVALPASPAVESGRGIIPVQIDWLAQADNLPDYLITLKLVDDTGEIWAQRDTEPRADRQHFSALKAGETLTDRHGLRVSAGTPPGEYRLVLRLTDPQSGQPVDSLRADGQPQGVDVPLGRVTVLAPHRPLLPAALPRQAVADARFGDALRLVGFTVPTRTVQTGDTLAVSLFWQGLSDSLPPLETWVQVQDASGAVVVSERPPVFPTDRWTRGTLLRDVHRLRIPADLPPGEYRLAAGVLTAEKVRLKTGRADQTDLGMVLVSAREHNFSAPEITHPMQADFGGAALVGFNLMPAELRPGDTLDLTLYFRVEKGFDREWAIFAHIISADGHIWAQRDGFPRDGTFPTTAWVAGEYITDRRAITLPADLPPGEYRLEIGLYDPRTFERVPVGAGDAVTLPAAVQVDK